MILILSQFADDETVLQLRDMLRGRGVDPVVVTPAVLEEPSSFSIQTDQRGQVQAILRLPGRTIDLREVRAAWLWRGWSPHPLAERFRPLTKQRETWQFFSQEWSAFYKGFSLALAALGAFCVNPPPWNTAYEEKCCQLALAAEVGLRIPPTLYTTRLPIARAFYAEHGGSIIYKPFRAYVEMVEPADGERWRVARLLTNRVQEADLVETEGYLPTPGIFQPYVPKDVELRVVVVGRHLFACAIHSQRSEKSREDWRRYDVENTPYVPYDLPVAVAEKIRRLMDRLGLVFGSIDMIVTPEGEHVFLEVNPNGQFGWVAQLSGLPIYEHLAALLLAAKVEDVAPPVAEVSHAG